MSLADSLALIRTDSSVQELRGFESNECSSNDYPLSPAVEKSQDAPLRAESLLPPNPSNYSSLMTAISRLSTTTGKIVAFASLVC